MKTLYSVARCGKMMVSAKMNCTGLLFSRACAIKSRIAGVKPVFILADAQALAIRDFAIMKDWQGKYLYFARNEHTQLIKIGCTALLSHRLSKIESLVQAPITLLGVIEGTRRDEKELHRQFASAHAYLEWFNPTAGLLDYIKANTHLPIKKPYPVRLQEKRRRMVEIQPKDTPAVSTTRLSQIADEIRGCLSRVKWESVVIGQRLLEAKAILPYGQFTSWIEEEFDFTDRTAQNFMNVAKRFVGTPEIVSLLPTTILYQLAAPTTTKKAIDVVVERVSGGEILTVSQVKGIIEEMSDKSAKPHRNGRKPVEQHIQEAAATVAAEAQSTGGYVSVGGDSIPATPPTIAAAITEEAAEGVRRDGEQLAKQAEREDGVENDTKYKHYVRVVSATPAHGLVTLCFPELARAVRPNQLIMVIAYVPNEDIPS